MKHPVTWVLKRWFINSITSNLTLNEIVSAWFFSSGEMCLNWIDRCPYSRCVSYTTCKEAPHIEIFIEPYSLSMNVIHDSNLKKWLQYFDEKPFSFQFYVHLFGKKKKGYESADTIFFSCENRIKTISDNGVRYLSVCFHFSVQLQNLLLSCHIPHE